MHVWSQSVRRRVNFVRSVRNETTSQSNVEIQMTKMCMCTSRSCCYLWASKDWTQQTANNERNRTSWRTDWLGEQCRCRPEEKRRSENLHWPTCAEQGPEEGNIPTTHTGRHSPRTLEGTCLLHHRSEIRLLACESRWSQQSSHHILHPLRTAIEGLEGVHCVADDIMLYGVGCTDDEAAADHDTKLHALLQRCRDVGIRLNKSRIKLRQKSLTFLGHLITDKGLKPDPEKVKAIETMPSCTDCSSRYGKYGATWCGRSFFSVGHPSMITFGHSVRVQSDHKPLESILKKPLFSALKGLQGMIMRLQRYNIEVVYTQGKLLYLADTLSRAFLSSTNQVN